MTNSCKESNLSILLHADDIALFSETEEGIQSMLIPLTHYCKKWVFSVDTERARIFVFARVPNLLYI